MDPSKVTERVNDEGAVEINVETVDYRTPAGRDSEPDKEEVEITHLIQPEDKKPGTGNVVSEAAGKVAEKVQSAKEVFTGSKGDEKK